MRNKKTGIQLQLENHFPPLSPNLKRLPKKRNSLMRETHSCRCLSASTQSTGVEIENSNHLTYTGHILKAKNGKRLAREELHTNMKYLRDGRWCFEISSTLLQLRFKFERDEFNGVLGFWTPASSASRPRACAHHFSVWTLPGRTKLLFFVLTSPS